VVSREWGGGCKNGSSPRANVYAVLTKLEERGAVVRVETEAGAAYTPIPPDELFQHLNHQFEGALRSARRLLLPLSNGVEDQYVQNLDGQAKLFQHAHDLMHEASTELLVAVWQAEAEAFAEASAQAQGRGITFTTLCFRACAEACPYCRPPLYRFHISVEDPSRWFIIGRDNAEMVLGTMGPKQTVGIRTKQPRLVEMASGYIRHSIALAALLTDRETTLDSLTTHTLRNALGSGTAWLDAMLTLLKS
jgi:HTH-type transcriptional regulator, sugar sensing transcriptional regulator